MSYAGYIPFAKSVVYTVPAPRVLEIGVDRGQTLVPLVVFLARSKESFAVHGVDVREDESLVSILRNIDLGEDQRVFVHVANSLEWLKNRADAPFDLVFIDGDHNFETVSAELDMLVSNGYLGDQTVVICDDYFGRWSKNDLYYSERDTHAGNELATEAPFALDSGKRGVAAAVDAFVDKNPSWMATSLMAGEPVVLLNKGDVLAIHASVGGELGRTEVVLRSRLRKDP